MYLQGPRAQEVLRAIMAQSEVVASQAMLGSQVH